MTVKRINREQRYKKSFNIPTSAFNFFPTHKHYHAKTQHTTEQTEQNSLKNKPLQPPAKPSERKQKTIHVKTVNYTREVGHLYT